ncbi:MAG TPA: DUF2877 domain-containing protein, partial [Actinomycetota bacterium]|nr:DUF2877 domain-containing protein [Actinomycetota bacterium]
MLPAHRVATPVLERLRGGGVAGSLLGVSATAAWVDLSGFVAAVTTREVPLLPNAVALTAGAAALGGAGAAGGAVRWSPGRVEVGGLRVVWDPAEPPRWDPAVRAGVGAGEGRPSPTSSSRSDNAPAAPVVGAVEVGRRGAAVLAAAGVRVPRKPAELVRGLAAVGVATVAEAEGAVGVELLLRAVLEGDAAVGAEAAELLLGRGPGLTPEGDDLLAAVAGTLVVLGPVVGLDRAVVGELVGALVNARGRTTALAATLLELAGR